MCGHPKICQLQNDTIVLVLLDEDIRWLQIAVVDLLGVEVEHRREQLTIDILEGFLVKVPALPLQSQPVSAEVMTFVTLYCFHTEDDFEALVAVLRFLIYLHLVIEILVGATSSNQGRHYEISDVKMVQLSDDLDSFYLAHPRYDAITIPLPVVESFRNRVILPPDLVPANGTGVESYELPSFHYAVDLEFVDSTVTSLTKEVAL